ncbi:hypothetical protein [Sphingomonas profundi]|uniref:hypothetical protein n=1 Tax=Alterirhizorhabdus profundi TaxID=2681549 RepID=UPI0012E8F111|nr:hypothetical protein [Sphingomonas profundi]
MTPALRLIFAAAAGLAIPATAQAADDGATPFAATSVSNDELGAIAGKTDLNMVVDARNTSEVSHNSVSGSSVTGTIRFDGSSFADLHGLSVLSANTGNNVSINASLNVNVAIRP